MCTARASWALALFKVLELLTLLQVTRVTTPEGIPLVRCQRDPLNFHGCLQHPFSFICTGLPFFCYFCEGWSWIAGQSRFGVCGEVSLLDVGESSNKITEVGCRRHHQNPKLKAGRSLTPSRRK